MTVFQVVASLAAFAATAYYASALWRSDERLSGANCVVWGVFVVAAAVSFVGFK